MRMLDRAPCDGDRTNSQAAGQSSYRSGRGRAWQAGRASSSFGEEDLSWLRESSESGSNVDDEAAVVGLEASCDGAIVDPDTQRHLRGERQALNLYRTRGRETGPVEGEHGAVARALDRVSMPRRCADGDELVVAFDEAEKFDVAVLGGDFGGSNDIGEHDRPHHGIVAVDPIGFRTEMRCRVRGHVLLSA